MAKKRTGSDIYDVPMSLRDQPFYGLVLDEQQQVFRDAIWDENKLIANCNIKLSISSVRISLETARCGLGEEGAVGDRRGQAERAGQAAKILSISASKASSGVL